MKVLITGAFGNLGLMCIRQALSLGYTVSCFDLDTPNNRKLAENFPELNTVFGDIRDTAILSAIINDVDAIIHNASVLPPVTDNAPELARQVNIDACKQLIQLAEKSPKQPVFIFPSSVTVFGQPELPHKPKQASDAVKVSDNYTEHKLHIEEYLRTVSIPWVVLRVGVSVDARTLLTDRKTFRTLLAVKADNPLEYVHPKDVALAMCRAVTSKEAWGKCLLIGGGASCQINQRVFLRTAFDALGLSLPMSVHGEETFYTHWLDTSESQRLLQYQQHSFTDYIEEMQQVLKPLSILLWPLRWLINPLLLVLLKRI